MESTGMIMVVTRAVEENGREWGGGEEKGREREAELVNFSRPRAPG